MRECNNIEYKLGKSMAFEGMNADDVQRSFQKAVNDKWNQK